MRRSAARAAARVSGCLTYAGPPCIRGHLGERYTSDGSCVECKRLPSDTAARTAACLANRPTYEGLQCKRGHTERYTSNNDCVECRRMLRHLRRQNDPEATIAYRRAYHAKHRERIADQAKARYSANRDHLMALHKRWYENNKDRNNEYGRIWRDKNRERFNALAKMRKAKDPARFMATKKRWEQRNMEKVRAWNRAKNAKRRARKLASATHHKGSDILDLLRMQNGLCAYCSADLGDRYQIDHVIPLARGGSNGRENICLACKTCNSRKCTLTGDEFRARLAAKALPARHSPG